MRSRLMAAVAACVLALASQASAQTPIKFSLDWRFESPNSGFMVAIDKGYYKAEGLDVSMDPGAGSVDGINRVASGAYQMAMADINSLIRFRDNPANPPIKATFVLMSSPPFSIISLRKTGITKPKDLEGRLLGAPAADGAFANWAAFVRVAGIDTSKVKIENVGFPLREPMLMQGKVDAITAFGYNAANLLMGGFKPEEISVMYMQDAGLEHYGNALLVSPAFMRDNPEAVRRFIRASIRGFLDVAANPAEGIAAAMRRNSVLNEAGERMRLGMFLNDNMLTPEVRANGIGHVDLARLGRSIDQIGESFKFTNKPKVDDVYTEAFLPPRAERQVPASIAPRRN